MSALTPALTSGRPAVSGWNTSTLAVWFWAGAGAANSSAPTMIAGRIPKRFALSISYDTSIWSIMAFS